MDKKDYRKLGSRVGSLGGYSSIWLAEDHMLFCEDAQFIEKYKRFYFKDIQALIVKKTNKSLVTTLITFFLAMGSLWSLAYAGKGWNIFWEIIVGIIFLVLVSNVFKGQSCKTYIQTAVQKEELKGINRVKRFERFSKAIKPIILSSQGEMDPQILNIKYEEFLSKAESAQVNQPLPVQQDSLLHTMLFLLFMGWAFLVGAAHSYNNAILYWIILIVYLALQVLNIMAVAKQSRLNLKVSIKNWAWVSLAGMGLFFLMGYASLMSLPFQMSRRHHPVDPYAMNDYFFKHIPENHFIQGVIVVAFFTSFFIGAVGLILSARPRSEDKPSV